MALSSFQRFLLRTARQKKREERKAGVDFIDSFSRKDYKDENTVKSDPAELIETAKRALAKGELEIAENYSIKAIRTVMLDNSYKRNPEPYRCLAEVLERKAADRNFKLPQRQRFLLQAAALYNFVRNFLKTEDVEAELSKTLSKIVSRKLLDIQDNMVEMVGGNPLYCKFDSELKQNELKNFRNDVKQSLVSMECRRSSKNQESVKKCDVRQMLKDEIKEIEGLSDTISVRMKQFLATIINECLELLGTPPCAHEVIVLGSLARNEMTPYSDFEWAILTNSEEEKCKVFFRNLTNLVHLQIINLGETILPSMNIEAIKEAWFYDDITTRGVSFDGFLPQACKTPLGNMPVGNMPKFELIHTPEKMADFQNNDWYRKNWKLGDTLLTFSPLQPDKHILVDAYRTQMAEILSCPCDSECCKHDASCGAWPTRGSCRGLNTLCEDVSRYGDVMTGNNDLDDGKFYDVKKEIYRLTDRVFAALAKCYEVDGSGTFAILDELYGREIISSEARDNFASAAAIAIKLRISTYLEAGRQGEQLMASSNEETGTSVYYMPSNEKLFHFFFIAIPLYEELQKIKPAGNMPPSLTHSSFYDDSDVTMGHIYCRLLNYDEALKCYDRTLQQDPENLGIEIRRISIALCITKGTEEMDKIRENLDSLLCKIDQRWSELHQETTQFVNRLDVEESRQLIEVLLSSSSFFGDRKYFKLASTILFQFLDVEGSKRSAARELLMMKFAFIKHFPKSIIQQHNIDAVISEMTSSIDEEGVSTKSILWLNTFGEFLFNQGLIDKAYRCFQRALSMERFLYGTKPNVNMMTSLRFLGRTSMWLLMYRESRFYFESLMQQFESFGGPAGLIIKDTYLQLALLSIEMGYSAEESQCYLEKGLRTATDSGNDVVLSLDCALYCKLAVTWHVKHNQEQAWKSVSEGKACLTKIAGVKLRVKLTCLLAETLAKIKEKHDGKTILEEEVQKLTSQSQEKALCLMKLGKLCFEQGLASDAESYYRQALEVMVDMQENKNIFDILECRIAISKAILMDKRESEAKKVLDQTFIFVEKLPASWKKISFVQDMGKLYENLRDKIRVRHCFGAAIRTYRELPNAAKIFPLMGVSLEQKLGKWAENACAISSVDPEIAMQAQRSHYDRAAEELRQHVATGQVDFSTVEMFLSLVLQYTSVDISEKRRLLLETLKVSEIVYGKNRSNEIVTKVLEQLSNTYLMRENMQDAIKYRELLITMEMDLHSSNPFHEHIFQSLMWLASFSFKYPVGVDTVERAYEFLLSAQKDKASENSTAKAAAVRCFTSLGVLFCTLGDPEKAETLNEMANQLFSKIHESVERKKLLCKTTCDIMKEILPSKKILPSDRKKLSASIRKAFVALPLQDTFAEDLNTLENCSNGRENVKFFT
ncbi:PREDICTED: uncharacterized protein LOC109461575 [Paramuricea clavata]|uniref:PREDICTED: uncharacterized protein LOC109461575 n=1 Tax=Paramuricea clavata TaxID=317549 RepID=A0A6S7GM66_PARCT|nr:PREDICTED: uncharacterized protein LOC109461575 [Paramuricea clavata]